MKNLGSYGTPLTNRMAEVYRSKPTFEAWNAMCEHARDLERKLQLGADALRDIRGTEAIKSDAGWVIPESVRDDADEALKAIDLAGLRPDEQRASSDEPPPCPPPWPVR